jgi:hypothetical protein
MKGTWNAVGIGLLVLGLATEPSWAQSSGSADPDSVAPAPDSAEQGKKKGGGLFGKAKKLAGNKAVQQVAKTMACTMVPGGQVVAGAIDAASSEDVGEAAAGAAGAAVGQTCMPGGMGAAPSPAAGMPGVAGLAGLGGLSGGAAAAGLAGVALPGAVGGEADGAAMAYGGMPGGFDVDAVATCMGLSPEEFLLLSDPTGGTGREPTKEDLERQRRVAAKVDRARYQACVMQQFGGSMGGGGAGMPMPGAAEEEDAPADGKLSEAPGKSVGLPKDLKADLKKGRAAVRDVDWLTGGGNVAEAGEAGFAAAVAALAAALRETGGTWRADIYLDKRYGDEAATAIGNARLTTVLAAMEKAGLETGAVTAGKVKKDKRPRLEIVRTGK